VAKLEGGLGMPVPTTNCRACYEYELREGCSRVAGDEEEDDVDDLEGEFGLQDGDAGHDDDPQYVAKSMLRAEMSYARGGDVHPGFIPAPNVPLLTNGQMVFAYQSRGARAARQWRVP